MPVIVAALAAILLVVLASVVLIPATLVQRYRAGTARRRARPWLATLNAAGLGLSLVIFLLGAAFTNIWVPQALAAAAAGVVVGAAIGMLGLALTRWEWTPGALFYTPNRWLVLAVTVAVAGRLLYGFWRAWQAWSTVAADESWLVASGAAGSLGAGALILGYYLTYWLGVRARVARVRSAF